jgi:protein TonB
MKVQNVMIRRTASWIAGVVACNVLQSTLPAMAQQEGAPAAKQVQPAPAAPKATASKTEGQAAKTPQAGLPPKSLATWRGQVIAHLNSRKREFGNADGTSTVAFSIDRSGKVVSARILSSSGNNALDEEAVALTQRASPVPPPPSDVAGSTLHLQVPIRFKR